MDKKVKTFDLVSHINKNDDSFCVIWLFNIGVEKYWNNFYSGVVDMKEDIVINYSEEMLLLLARSQDVVIVRRKPQKEYLDELRYRGFGCPRILCPQSEDDSKCISELVLGDSSILECLKEIGEKDNVVFVPYGVSHFEEQIAAVCNLKMIGGPAKKSCKINNKIYSRQIAQELGFPISDGYECHTINELTVAYEILSKKYDKIVIKTPNNASGKGMWIVEDENRFKTVCMVIARLTRSNTYAVWLIEGWLDKKMDMNCQIFVAEDGKVDVFSVKEQVTFDVVYVGSIFPPRMTYEQYETCCECAKKIGKYLYEHSFYGVFGIDGLITTNGTIIPIIEINGRFTLSTYVSFLHKGFGNKYFYSFYKRVSASKSMDYSMFVSELKKRGVYVDGNKSGLFLYTSATLDTQAIGNIVRIFCVSCGNTIEETLSLKEQFDMICSELEMNNL